METNKYIQEYVKRRGITITQASRESGISKQRLHQLIKKGDRVGPKIAKQIFFWTKGEIKLADMRPDIWGM